MQTKDATTILVQKLIQANSKTHYEVEVLVEMAIGMVQNVILITISVPIDVQAKDVLFVFAVYLQNVALVPTHLEVHSSGVLEKGAW